MSRPNSNQTATGAATEANAPDPPLLEVENLRTTFATDEGELPAVDGISFTVEEGELFGLVGESGSGKSVTARSIMRLLESNGRVEADAIRFEGTDLLELSDDELNRVRGSDISMIFQDPMSGLNPVMTIGEQIAEVVRHHGDTGERTGFWSEMQRKYVTGTDEDSPSWQRAVELLDAVGIPDPADRASEFPHQLSGGMKQRVMIAQALAGDPDLIVADEPTTALDVTIEAQILGELLDLRDEFGVSVILITHDLAVIRETCDRVAVMYSGELMETASTADLFANPSHPYTRGLLQSIPKADGDQESLDAIPGQVPDPMDKPTGCPFRDRCPHAFEACDQDLVAYSPTPDDTIPEDMGLDVAVQTAAGEASDETPGGTTPEAAGSGADTAADLGLLAEGETSQHPVYCHLYNPCVETDDEGNVVSVDEGFDEERAARRRRPATDATAGEVRPDASSDD